MKFKVLPNRTASEKEKVSDKNKMISKDQEADKSELNVRKESGRVPTRFQADDDYDNWFPWETY